MNESSLSDAALAELLTLTVGVDVDGAIRYYNHLGQLHREHGPAIEWRDGEKWWYQNDMLHRTDGPAIVRLYGPRAWYLYGKKYTEEEWNERTRSV